MEQIITYLVDTRIALIALLMCFTISANAQYYGQFPDVSTAAFDADYQAVLDEATSSGYTLPSGSQQTAQNQFVLDAKANGYWNDLDYFAVFTHDANINFCKINWVDPTSTKATTSNITHVDDAGCDCNNTSGYFDSNWAFLDGPNNSATDVGAGVWTDWSNSGATTYYYLGDGSASSDNNLKFRGSQLSTSVGITNLFTGFLSAGQQSEGLFSGRNQGVSASSAMKDGTTLLNASGTAATYTSNDVYFMNYNGGSACQTARVYRMVYAGALDNTEISDLFTDFDNYLTTIGL